MLSYRNSLSNPTLRATARASLHFLSLALVVSVAGSVTPPSRARACGNVYVKAYVLPEGVRRIEAAERLIARGDSRGAYRVAHEIVSAVVDAEAVDRRPRDFEGEGWYETIHSGEGEIELAGTSHPERATALELRARMLEAVLAVRLDGQISRNGRPARNVHPNVRAMHLDNARQQLESLLAAHSDDPRLVAYHAEAVARLDPAQAPATLRTLRDLATRDLIGDPLTWVALASLETEAGAREAALDHCRAVVSRGADSVCAVSGA